MSRFCHFLPINKDVIAIYNSLLIRVLYAQPWSVDLLKSFSNGMTIDIFLNRHSTHETHEDMKQLIKKMVEHEMLIPVQDNEYDSLQLLKKIYLAKPEITCMYVMLTDRCNLACGYCFVEKPLPPEHHFSMMQPETARWAIDQFVEWSEPKYVRSIIFYGGEPLLNRIALIAALDRIKEQINMGKLAEHMKLQLITNGTLVDDDFVSLVKVHNLKVSVSIDGMPEFHDAQRVDRSGKGSHEAAVRGYRLLREAGVPVGVSLTISRQHIGHLLENVLWLLDNLGVKSMGFNTIVDVDPVNVVPSEYTEAVNCEMIECFKVLRARGIYEDRIMRKVESFIAGTPYLHDCSGCGHQVVIAPDGRVGVCHGYPGWKTYFVKPEASFHPAVHPFWSEWSSRSPINMPQCFNCEAIGICGGGCPCLADIHNGSIWALNKNFCIHSKTVLRWMLDDLFRQTQKVV